MSARRDRLRTQSGCEGTIDGDGKLRACLDACHIGGEQAVRLQGRASRRLQLSRVCSLSVARTPEQ